MIVGFANKSESRRTVPCADQPDHQYIRRISTFLRDEDIGDIETAKLFKHGGSQTVRLPKHFRLPGNEVRVRRLGRGVLLEPIDRSIEDIKAIFAEIDRLGGADFLPEGRPEQPAMPTAEDVSFDR
jgi:antitoxin VapB